MLATVASEIRLLLFGLPGSGKSSLLGALVQAADSQSAVLHGRLVDATGRLSALRQSTYAGTPPATSEPVNVYPVHFEREGNGRVAATLLDCDGELAQQYMTGKRPLVPRDSTLARAMLEADTVILTLDASAGSQIASQLAAFRQFLTLLQETRSGRTDVAGLPVYLVLTKCDQLAKPEDTFSRWVQHIEEAKRKLDDRLAAFLAAKPHGPAFGSIDLHLWATAVRRPPLADRAAAAEPYGVAELFRQCLASAQAFDHREYRAGRRLELAVGSLGLLVILMLLTSALFVFTQPDNDLLRLEERVQTALPDPDAADARMRLRGDLPARAKELQEIETDPAFTRLPEKTRTAVQGAATEIASYVKAKEAFRVRVKQPYQAKNEKEFDSHENQARDFRLPPEYAEAWADTNLAAQLVRVHTEYASVRAAIADEVQWVRRQIDEGKKLFEEGNRLPAELADLDPVKQQQGRQHAQTWVAAYLKYGNRPSFRLSGDQPIAGSGSFPYADLRKFKAVQKARQEWEDVKDQLDKTDKYISTFTK